MRVSNFGCLGVMGVIYVGLLVGCSSITSGAPIGTTPQPATKIASKSLDTMGGYLISVLRHRHAGQLADWVECASEHLCSLGHQCDLYTVGADAGTFDFSSIDNALAVLNTYNATYPSHPVVAKLRVWEGQNVPAGVFSASGGTVILKGHNAYIQFPAFWTSAYHVAWVPLQNARSKL